MRAIDTWSCKERVMAALRGEEPDRWPIITPTSVVNVESMAATGAYFPDAHFDAHKMAALASTAHDILGFDTVAPYFSIILEAVALGCTLYKGQVDTMPSVAPLPLKNIDDFHIAANLLDRPPLVDLIRAIRLLRKKYGNDVAIIGKVMGPWTLAYHLFGVQNFLCTILAEPQKGKALLQHLLSLSVSFAKAQFENGADIITWADHSTSDLVSPSMYEEYLLPLHQQAVAALGREKPIILHTCGWALDRIRLFAKAGFTAYHFDSRNCPREALVQANNEMVLIGGLNNPHTLLNGTPDSVYREVKYLLDAGIRLIAPECAIPLRTTNRNLKAINMALRRYYRSCPARNAP